MKLHGILSKYIAYLMEKRFWLVYKNKASWTLPSGDTTRRGIQYTLFILQRYNIYLNRQTNTEKRCKKHRKTGWKGQRWHNEGGEWPPPSQSGSDCSQPFQAEFPWWWLAWWWSASMEKNPQTEAGWSWCLVWSAYFQKKPSDEFHPEQARCWRGHYWEPCPIRLHPQRWWRHHHAPDRITQDETLCLAHSLFACWHQWKRIAPQGTPGRGTLVEVPW